MAHIHIVFLARYAGKILQFSRSLVENIRFGSVDSHFLRKSRGKRWEASFSVFGTVSWKTLVLEGFILSFSDSLVENARFRRLRSPFLGQSRGKRSFWKASFSVFRTVSWKTLALGGFVLRFWDSLVENARFGRLHSQFLRKVLGKTLVLEVFRFSFWERKPRGRRSSCKSYMSFLGSLC